jgi:hypothetical protein
MQRCIIFWPICVSLQPQSALGVSNSVCMHYLELHLHVNFWVKRRQSGGGARSLVFLPHESSRLSSRAIWIQICVRRRRRVCQWMSIKMW